MANLKCFLAFAAFVSFVLPSNGQTVADRSSFSSVAPTVGVEVLSDTKGVQLESYFRVLTADLRSAWLTATSNESTAVVPAQGATTVLITLAPTGQLLSMKLENAGEQPAMERISWRVVRDATYQPLPAGLTGAPLTIRLHLRTVQDQ